MQNSTLKIRLKREIPVWRGSNNAQAFSSAFTLRWASEGEKCNTDDYTEFEEFMGHSIHGF